MKMLSGWHVTRGTGLVAAAMLLLAASTAAAQTADEVIAKNIKAQGGREALLGLKSLARKGTVAVDGTFGQMDGTIEEVCIPWKKARRSLDLAVFVQDDGYNGTVAWRDGMMGLQDLEGEEANQIKQAVELNPFVKMAERQSTAEKLDDETINDVECYVIQMTTKDKPVVKICIDKKTDQIVRTSLTQNNPQFGEIEVVAEPSDYAEFGPVKLATKNKVKFGDVFEFETTFTDTKVNAEVDETVFDKPKDEPADAPKDEAKDSPKEESK